MPIARPDVIPFVCEWFSQKSIKEIKSVLDVGSGFGLWGFLARQYIQIWQPGIKEDDYINFKNKMRVDAIEIVDFYVTDIQRQIYNNIYCADMRINLPSLSWYDLIICGDILEHINFTDGLKLLEEMRRRSRWVIITMPDYFARGNEIMGQISDLHEYVWKDNDFPDRPVVTHINKQKVIIYEDSNYADKRKLFEKSR